MLLFVKYRLERSLTVFNGFIIQYYLPRTLFKILFVITNRIFYYKITALNSIQSISAYDRLKTRRLLGFN